MKRWAPHSKKLSHGFTIVELIIVIVVIGILAVIVIVGYGAVVNNASDTAVKADLQKIDDAFKQYNLDNQGVYPDSTSKLSSLGLKLNPDSYSTSNAANIYLCLNPTSTEYAVISMGKSGKRFVAKSEKGIAEYAGSVVWDSSNINFAATCTSIDSTYIPAGPGITGLVSATWQAWTGQASTITCPTGYIIVPGNSMIGTSDFCIMKYEARNVGGVATSQSSGFPWASITQASAVTAASAACSGCHIVSEAEWMTVAYNIASVGSNWTGGVVGSGSLYTGHTDNVPSSALAGGVGDNDGYSGTGNTVGSTQRRTMTLTNGEVIWDFGGNLHEWTDGVVTSGQFPGVVGDASASWRPWNTTNFSTHGLPAYDDPTRTIVGASGWNTNLQGIGDVYSSYNDSVTRPMLRGGCWSDANAGIFVINLSVTTAYSGTPVGFRVSK